ncbi:MAG: hypothetical protein ACJAS6_000930 [Rickettsiales bacterium]|jgi:hypothetical protein
MTREESRESMLMCKECIGNDLVQSFIDKKGMRGHCSINNSHSAKNKVISCPGLIIYIDEQFQKHYCVGEQYSFFDDSDRMHYEQRGEDLVDCIAGFLECDYELAEIITNELKKDENYDAAGGEHLFYDDSIRYESREDVEARDAENAEYWYENQIQFKWQEFCEYVKHSNRFFNIRSRLDELFGNADRYSEGERSPIYFIYKGSSIYRARKTDENSYDKLKKSPMSELGPPPPDKSVNGRMNVQHIPVFYGAFDSKVAVSELRPFIQEKVALGKFTLAEDIKVFDFTVYDNIFDDKYRNSDYHETRYDILSYMQSEISQPVSLNSQSLEYVPTQIISEYIKEHFKVDAIIYFSSLVPEDSKNDRRNIVIFDSKKLIISSDDVSSKSIRRIDYCIEDGDLF